MFGALVISESAEVPETERLDMVIFDNYPKETSSCVPLCDALGSCALLTVPSSRMGILSLRK